MGCSSSKSKEEDPNDSSKFKEDEYVEDVVCKVSDIKENEMKVFDLKDQGKVLLVKQNGELNALGTKCTHYGAPLVNGALGDGRIRCQWHGACFNIKTGDIEDFPGLDSLPCYKVTINNGEVLVRAKKSELSQNARVKTMVKLDAAEEQQIIVIGGGPAGAKCVETLRQEGFKGKIYLIAKEDALPYDRVKVSKNLDIELEKIQFRDENFYKEHGIEIFKRTEAIKVDSKANTVILDNGKELRYDRLFIATGSRPLKLDIPGKDLKNVFTIRDHADAKNIISQIDKDKEAVVLGGSFIAMESAASLVNKVNKVTVVCRDSMPFKKVLGEEIGLAIRKIFESNGVVFKTMSNPKSIDDDGKGCIKSVTLTDGTVLKADLCIMGLGSTYYTEFLKGSGIDLRNDGSIEVDQFLQTNLSNVFAGGDLAYAPVWSHGVKNTIGHYGLAHLHGHVAAKNMLNIQTPLRAVPFFWTMLFGKSLRYCGHGSFESIIYYGNVQELKFVAFYLNGNEVTAICTCQMDPIASQFAERISSGRKLLREDLVEGDEIAWTKSK